jgi:hypothetical protein
MDPQRDFDNDRSYRTPAGWRKAREALGGDVTELGQLFREVERLVREGTAGGAACPRFALVLALSAFVRAAPERRAEILFNEYTDWCGERERRKTEQGFEQAMGKLFGDGWKGAA